MCVRADQTMRAFTPFVSLFLYDRSRQASRGTADFLKWCVCTARDGTMGYDMTYHYLVYVGGSTSVGLVGIQIAKAVGAYVVTSCSAKNFDLVKQMGADEVTL